ncbi:putative Ig domain-containing protein [Sphingomonas sp. BT-65]|uniref:putative Ig domain-containing protein n=1 Tax=Sphingomonas sp. BT-65 TaxID=2989821 RepID=UPI0022363AF2|nr:putative Ig domain-containing protein [Sphingomonas sp. BT-65]MCW4462037.1 putative Ig domain-containing protein [Sphingomonas sp. BT-65]
MQALLTALFALMLLVPASAQAQVTIAPAVLPGGSAGSPYSAVLTASGGTAPYSFSLQAGALPVGLAFSSAGVLSGTPVTTGTFNFTVRATDSLGVSGTQAYSVTIAAPTIVLSPAAGALPGATASVPYSQTFTASGGTGPYSFSLPSGALPVGMFFSSAGNFSGTPTVPGTYNFSVRATDAHGFNTTNNYSITVTAPTIVLSPPAGALPGATASVPYNQTLTASGGTGPYSFSLPSGAPPIGIAFSSVGNLSGTPTVPGTYNFSVRATDAHGFNTTNNYSITVTAPTIVLSPAAGPLPGVTAYTPYSLTFTASGGTGPYAFSLPSGALPLGISMSSGGVFAGTPTTPGTYNFSVRTTDAHGFSATNAYSFTVTAPVITVAPGSLPNGATLTAYSQTLAASGGAAPYTFSPASGALPPGLSLSAAGVISGTPTAPGSFSFAVRATDAHGFTGSAAYTLAIDETVPTAAGQSVTVVGGRSVTIDALAGSTGAPITGVAIATPPAHGSATVSGTSIVYTANATYAGADSFTYTLTNGGGTSAPATVSVTVNPAPLTAPPKAVTILAGQTASVLLTEGASGGPFTGAATVSITPASSGTANIVSSGGQFTLRFQPASSFSGVVTILYTLTNAHATSAPGTVTITVEARPDPTRDPDVIGLINAQVSAARRFATTQISNVNHRLERLHDDGGEGGFTNNVRMAGPGGRYRPDNLAAGGSELDPRKMNRGQGGAPDLMAAPEGLRNTSGNGGAPSAVGIWTSGSINWGQRDPNDYSAGYQFTTDGITFGLDYRLSDSFVAGVAAGYAHDDTRIGEDATRSRAESYSGTLYASFHPGGGIFLDGLAGYGGLSFRSQRYVVPLSALARGERDGHQWFGSLTAGYDYRDGPLHLVPYGRIEVTRSTLGAFTEHGTGPYDLHYALQTADTLTGVASLRGDYRIPARFGFVVPRFRVEYSHDFEGSTRALLSYADWVGGPTYSFEGLTLARDRVLIGGGFDVLVGERLKLGLDYEGLLQSGGEANRVILSIALGF